MKPEIQEILDLSKISVLKAQEKCILFVESAKSDFLEQLTVNTATDFIGAVLLFSNLCAAEKKPWKATPFLEECWGAVRFLEDFIQDRSVLGGTCVAIASAYEYANFYPEAQKYYLKAIQNDPNASNLEDLAFSYFLMGYFSFGSLRSEAVKAIEERFDQNTIKSLKNEAKESFQNSLKTDPIEREEVFLSIRYDLEKKVDQMLSEEGKNEEPFCIRYWKTKKVVLKNDFQLEWKSPADLNPHINFC